VGVACQSCAAVFVSKCWLMYVLKCCRQVLKKQEPVYQALWANNTDFDEVLISPVMIQDHMPDTVLEALKKVRKVRRATLPLITGAEMIPFDSAIFPPFSSLEIDNLRRCDFAPRIRFHPQICL